MFSLSSLTLPVIGAPMAGGPSTPQLAAAAGEAGGLGFLAAGYKSPGAVAAQIEELRRISSRPFGVNLFVPETANTYADAALDGAADKAAGNPAGKASHNPADNVSEQAADTAAARAARQVHKIEAALAYRAQLIADQDETAQHAPDHAVLPAPGMPDPQDDDGWHAKLDLVLRERVPVVSFTFGVPEPAVFAELAAQGICAMVTVTDAHEARAAADAGARMLCVQGPEAGGHRGTMDSAKVPGEVPLTDLLRAVRDVCGLPLVAAGGISTSGKAAAALAAGADAVQVGTLLLLSSEAGTSEVYRSALLAAVEGRRESDTSLTRAFSGRPARGLINGFLRAHPDAPDAYPYVNHVTAPLRAAAAAALNPEAVSLWAGTGVRDTVEGPAAEILRRLVRAQ